MQPVKAQGLKHQHSENTDADKNAIVEPRESQLQIEDEDDAAHDMTEDDLAIIQAGIRTSIAQEQAGLRIDAREAIAHLRARR